MRRLGFGSVLIGWLLALGCTPRYGNLPLAPPLAYSVGEDQLRRGDTEEAIHSFEVYLESGQSTYRPRALYQLARARYLSESYPAALETLDQLEREYPDISAKQANALRGDIAYATGHRVDAVLSWEKAYAVGEAAEREALLPRLRAAVDGMTENEAIELANLATAPEIYDMAIDRLPSAALPGDRGERGQPVAAPRDPMLDTAVPSSDRATAAAVADEGVGPKDSLEAGATAGSEPAAAAVAAVPATVGAAEPATVDGAAAPALAAQAGNVATGPHVACLLPLTGADRAAGRLALDQLRRAFVSSSTHLVVRDSGSDADLAARLTGQLAADPTVLALIGPLSAAEVKRAAAVANATGLPILPLSNTAGIEDLPRQAQHAADTVLESIEVAGDDTRDRIRETLSQKDTTTAPDRSGTVAP